MLRELAKREMANNLKMKHLEDEIYKIYRENKIEKADYIKLMSLVKSIKPTYEFSEVH